MTYCTFTEADGSRVCVRCGRRVAATGKIVASCRGPGLGDMVAAGLDSIGITKERVEQLVGRPCGCPERQAALNAAGVKWLGLPAGSTAPPRVDPPT
jgi:hypothetical protein